MRSSRDAAIGVVISSLRWGMDVAEVAKSLDLEFRASCARLNRDASKSSSLGSRNVDTKHLTGGFNIDASRKSNASH
jgi:hypothetical protein